jgi:hypothetical protein
VNSIYCSSKSGVFADEVEFVNSVGFAVENVTRTAVKKWRIWIGGSEGVVGVCLGAVLEDCQ